MASVKDFSVGDRITHERYGKGRVITALGIYDVTVRFDYPTRGIYERHFFGKSISCLQKIQDEDLRFSKN